VYKTGSVREIEGRFKEVNMNATGPLGGVVRCLRRAALLQDGAGMTDGELLERYVRHRDEVAFEALVRRHGPMVLGVCRRVLANEADAEDAFQATFLILVRKAAAVVPRALVGNWLYGVAHNTARKAKAMSSKRRAKEKHAGQAVETGQPKEDWSHLRAALDEALECLPEKYRVPVVLCDLEGRPLREAARQLGWPLGTVAGRLARARVLLAKRLMQRGLMLTAGALAAALAVGEASACIPQSLIRSTMQAAASFAPSSAATAGSVSATVAALTEGVLKDMLLSKLKIATAVLLLAVLTVMGLGNIAGPELSAARQWEEQKVVGRPQAKPKEAVKGPPEWQVRATLEGHTDRVSSVVFSPGGKLLATASADGTVKLWDFATRKVLATLKGHEGVVGHVVFSPDGKWVATAGYDDRTARIWDVATGQELQKLVHNERVYQVAFAPDGKTLIVGGGFHEDGGQSRPELRFWDPATGKERDRLTQGPKLGIQSFVISSDGKLLITGTGNTFTIWEWDGKGQLKERHSAQAEVSGFVYGMALSPDDRTLAITWDAKVHLYDVATGKLRTTLEKSHVGCWGPLSYSPDGKTVAASIIMQEPEGNWVVQRRTLLRSWDATTGKVRETSLVPGAIESMTFSPDGKALVVGSRGGTRFRTLRGGIIDTSSIEEEKKDGTIKILTQ
jgi:RNA polymerase sigma factor (sigma-70 family)